MKVTSLGSSSAGTHHAHNAHLASPKLGFNVFLHSLYPGNRSPLASTSSKTPSPLRTPPAETMTSSVTSSAVTSPTNQGGPPFSPNGGGGGGVFFQKSQPVMSKQHLDYVRYLSRMWSTNTTPKRPKAVNKQASSSNEIPEYRDSSSQSQQSSLDIDQWMENKILEQVLASSS